MSRKGKPPSPSARATGRISQPAALLTFSFTILLTVLLLHPRIVTSLHSHDSHHPHPPHTHSESEPLPDSVPGRVGEVKKRNVEHSSDFSAHNTEAHDPAVKRDAMLYNLASGPVYYYVFEDPLPVSPVVERQVEPPPPQPDLNALQNGVAELMNIEYGQLQHWVLRPEEIYKNDNLNILNQDPLLQEELRRREEGEGGEGEGGNDAPPVLRKRQQNEPREVHLTFNTCFQPNFNQSLPLEQPLSQLSLYVSNTTANQSPGPQVFNRPQTIVPVAAGYASITLLASDGIWVGVYAPNLDRTSQSKYTGPWNYEIALSTAKPYHSWETTRTLYLIDSDNSAALLITGNMTQSEHPSEDEINGILDSPLPYQLYAQNTNYTSSISGIERSFCALRPLVASQVGKVATSYTRRGLGNLPKQQFHITGLNKSSQYQIYLTKPDRSLTTGGVLYEPITITTKSDGNCQIIYDLPFCSEVAYAVPANPTIFDSAGTLGAFYDNIARNWYTNFSYSLEQVQCGGEGGGGGNFSTGSGGEGAEDPGNGIGEFRKEDLTRRYSYERGCTDCASAYKTWLCAVTIPRCADFTSSLPYLAERGTDTEFFNKTSNLTIPNASSLLAKATGWAGVANSTLGGAGRFGDPHEAGKAALRSRNSEIEKTIRPGPYKEIKPCMDLCYSVVQSCPAQMGFTCPRKGTWGKEVSYGERSQDGDVSCSWLGAAYFLSGATGRWAGAGVWGVGGLIVLVMVYEFLWLL